MDTVMFHKSTNPIVRWEFGELSSFSLLSSFSPGTNASFCLFHSAGYHGRVNKIRAQKKVYDQDPRNSFLCLRKVASLDALQFSWGRQKGDVLWEQHFKELQRFHQEKGHCNVPTKPAPGSSYKTLGRFVSTQRTQYKLFHSSRGESKSLLNQSKIDRLNELNFCWDLSLPRKTPKSSLAKGTRRRTRSTPAESLCQPEGNEESSSPSTAAQPWEEV
mmetsp:Transcript_32954/g.68644  ORF Transcript_32954/g.68644 Transcript_32954/m.68644 type:complete len:217 (-) Transcript_32954:270-920(-)